MALAAGGGGALLAGGARGAATLGQLAEPLDMSLPAVHQHLGALERAGLVSCEKRGRERWCRLERDTLRLAESWLEQRRSAWERRLDALGDYLSNPTPRRKRR